MVRNSPCSVCFLTSKPFRIGGIDLFVVCLVSIGCSLLFISFYQFFSRRTRKTNFFRPISLLIIFLFFFIFILLDCSLFIEGLSDGLDFV